MVEEAVTPLLERIAALENNPAQGQDLTPTTGLTREQVEALIERAIDDHCETYNHDDYDSVVSNWNDEDPADFLREGDLHDQIDDRVHETLRNATFSISI
jgi:hypothetical protein